MTKKKLILIILLIAAVPVAGYLLWWNVYLPWVARRSAPEGSLFELALSERIDTHEQAEVLKEGYRDNYFIAFVKEVSQSSGKMLIGIDLGHADGSENHVLEEKSVDVQCPADRTTDFGTRASGIDLLAEAGAEDVILAYCLDENCSAIGKECVLIKAE